MKNGTGWSKKSEAKKDLTNETGRDTLYLLVR